MLIHFSYRVRLTEDIGSRLTLDAHRSAGAYLRAQTRLRTVQGSHKTLMNVSVLTPTSQRDSSLTVGCRLPTGSGEAPICFDVEATSYISPYLEIRFRPTSDRLSYKNRLCKLPTTLTYQAYANFHSESDPPDFYRHYKSDPPNFVL